MANPEPDAIQTNGTLERMVSVDGRVTTLISMASVIIPVIETDGSITRKTVVGGCLT